MTALFDLSGYTSSPVPVHDPYWDEIVLDVSTKPDQNGQLTLFYDSSEEAPDPDDYPSIEDYYSAWDNWERRYPDLALLVGEQAKKDTAHQQPSTSIEFKNSKQVKNNTAHQHTHFVETYWVRRSGKKHYYYRYVLMMGRGMDRTYIGSTKSPKAIAIVEEIRQAIARQESPIEIEKLIRSSKITTG